MSSPIVPPPGAAFPKIKQLLLDRNEPAANSMYSRMLGPYNEAYMPLGNLKLHFPIHGVVHDYQRTLDLSSGVATVKFSQDGVTYTRQTFASYPDQVPVMRLSADHPGKISLSADLSSQLRYEVTTQGNELRMTGRCPSHANPDYIGAALTYDQGPNPKGMRFVVEVGCVPMGATSPRKTGNSSQTIATPSRWCWSRQQASMALTKVPAERERSDCFG